MPGYRHPYLLTNVQVDSSDTVVNLLTGLQTALKMKSSSGDQWYPTPHT